MRLLPPLPGSPTAFTLIEVVVSTTIAAIVVGGMIYAYVTSATRTEW